MTLITLHDCKKCQLRRREIETAPVDYEDIEVFKRIQLMITNSEQAADPSSIENLPDYITDEEKKAYLEKTSKNYQEKLQLLTEWWQLMKEKYGIPDSAKFESDYGKFYECYDPDTGIADITGQFYEKGTKRPVFSRTTIYMPTEVKGQVPYRNSFSLKK